MDKMEVIANNHKIIMFCNPLGIVEQLFLDTASLLDTMLLPVGLHSIVAPDSIAQLGIFWLSIQEKSMEENIILSLSYNDRQIRFIFSGYLLKDKVLLCGNTEMNTTEKALEEIMLINNEQANHIRLSEKKVGKMLQEVKSREMSEAFLNDFSSLNNELINNKRELMRKNQKIEVLNQELNAVNENLSMFTHSVSHDLNEPVRMINLFLVKLDKKFGDLLDEKGQSYMNFALDGAKRIGKMLENLLAHHQSTNLDSTETVDLNDVFSEVIQILKERIILKNAQITSENLPIVTGSATGLLQVFQNLISNGIKFVPKGCTPVISVKAEESASNYTLIVTDNGIGIPEKKLLEVFSLFKRLNSSAEYEGTGMGLALVKKNIERMGGEIWIESTPGEGSTFYFTLPKHPVNNEL